MNEIKQNTPKVKPCVEAGTMELKIGSTTYIITGKYKESTNETLVKRVGRLRSILTTREQKAVYLSVVTRRTATSKTPKPNCGLLTRKPPKLSARFSVGAWRGKVRTR
jgi:hypothetical protein